MNDCLFCNIIRRELPAYVVYEDDETIAFLDIHPVTRGHTLVIPKTHATNIFDMTPKSWASVTQTVHTLSPLLEKRLHAQGINLMMNNRAHAGQVVDHPHVHMIPRYRGDGLTHWRSGSYTQGEAEEVLEQLR